MNQNNPLKEGQIQQRGVSFIKNNFKLRTLNLKLEAQSWILKLQLK